MIKSQEERTVWLVQAVQKNERLQKIVERVAQYDDAADRAGNDFDGEEKAYLRGIAEGLREAFGILSR